MHLEPIARLLADAIGLDPASLGERGLARAVETGMARAGVADPDDYARLLAANPGALDDLVREVVVPETWFFRDSEPFACLRERLGKLSRRGKRPRILSAPCATGEEAYSIAITCLEAGLAPGGFHLTAVDISADSLAVAARAQYGHNSFRGDLNGAQRHFISQGEGRARIMTVRPEIAATVAFSRQNIVDEQFLATEKPFDVIFSRNLLIYLDQKARKRLVANIGRLLAPDGLLFTGHSEIQSFLAAGYRCVSHARAFACHRETPRAAPPGTPAGTAVFPAPSTAAPGPGMPSRSPARTAVQAEPGTPAPPARPVHASSAPILPAPVAPPQAARGEDDLDAARRLADRGELAKAAELCRRHLAAHHGSAEAYYLLGLVDAAEHRVEEAKSLFQKALYLEPEHAGSLAHLALIHDQQGDAARAGLVRQRLRRLSEPGRNGHERG